MKLAFRTALLAAALALAALPSRAQSWPDAPPNLVRATATIFTSGQPPAKSLEALKAQGAVMNALEGPWKRLVEEQLKKHGVPFDVL